MIPRSVHGQLRPSGGRLNMDAAARAAGDDQALWCRREGATSADARQVLVPAPGRSHRLEAPAIMVHPSLSLRNLLSKK